MSGGDSDSHNRGHKIYILALGSGKRLIYKPRNLKVDEVYYDILKWVTQNIGVIY